MEDKIDLLIKSVNDIKVTQNKLVNSVNSISKKVIDLADKLSTLSSDIDSVKLRVATMEKRIDSLGDAKSASSSVTNNDLITELIDRQSRLKNVLLFNLPESSSNSIASTDATSVEDILKFLGLHIKPTFLSRIGSPSSSSPNKPRPLKLCFADLKEIYSIFAAQIKLKSHATWKDLRFSSDRTKSQRESMALLREELQRRRSNGEPELIINTNTQTLSSSPKPTIYHTNWKDTQLEMYDSAVVLDSMKEKIRLLLGKHKNGILCNEFMDIYDTEYNGGFTFSEYGFKSIRDMAFQLPSVFYVKESEENGDYILYEAHRRSEFENVIDPSLYYKNIPKTVLYNLSMVFDKNRTGISLVELKNLYCREFGRCYEPSKYGYYSEEHMFELLNKMIQIKDDKLYTIDPFAYIDFTNDYDYVSQNKKTGPPLVVDRVLFNYTGKDICNAKFEYFPFQLTEGNLMDVITAEVYNPNSFYIHLKSKLEILNKLMANLQEYYDANEQKYTVLPDLLVPGLACCLQFENTNNWHRAKILTIIDKDYVKVAYVDFGSYEIVNKSRIRFLVSKFSIEPVLALHCCLYSDDKFNFSRETNELFVEMVDGFDLEARFHGFTTLKDRIEKMRLHLFLKLEDMEYININKHCAKHIKQFNKSGTSVRRVMCEIEQEVSFFNKLNTLENKNNS